MASAEDGLDRLLISFKDAKVGAAHHEKRALSHPLKQIALLEWSDAHHDLLTVSIHTYERTPQVVSILPLLIVTLTCYQMNGDLARFKALLRVDPASSCAALSLPQDSIAIIPFYQNQADLDMMDTTEGPAFVR